ncbi:hypothetical protein FH972_024558 [Carpinus fangiana]|uniref:F-box domain-containing protein n=1 Tax=Carpinus fangiana TaxID=176857 RepID=A0A5N6L0W1_9ROSI|nr:hypothetical protein FH972_024558 [Carpinus fangiana]
MCVRKQRQNGSGDTRAAPCVPEAEMKPNEHAWRRGDAATAAARPISCSTGACVTSQLLTALQPHAPFRLHLCQICSHPLLAQVPLTVSPFVSLPTATTLPYTYKTLPSSLPPSSTGAGAAPTPNPEGDTSRSKYVHSSTGHAAHPADIISSCQALGTHLDKLQSDGQTALSKWDDDIRAAELAEKRKLAPGYLDRNEKILSPSRANVMESTLSLDQQPTSRSAEVGQMHSDDGVQDDAEGQELDRAFANPARIWRASLAITRWLESDLMWGNSRACSPESSPKEFLRAQLDNICGDYFKPIARRGCHLRAWGAVTGLHTRIMGVARHDDAGTLDKCPIRGTTFCRSRARQFPTYCANEVVCVAASRVDAQETKGHSSLLAAGTRQWRTAEADDGMTRSAPNGTATGLPLFAPARRSLSAVLACDGTETCSVRRAANCLHNRICYQRGERQGWWGPWSQRQPNRCMGSGDPGVGRSRQSGGLLVHAHKVCHHPWAGGHKFVYNAACPHSTFSISIARFSSISATQLQPQATYTTPPLDVLFDFQVPKPSPKPYSTMSSQHSFADPIVAQHNFSTAYNLEDPAQAASSYASTPNARWILPQMLADAQAQPRLAQRHCYHRAVTPLMVLTALPNNRYLLISARARDTCMQSFESVSAASSHGMGESGAGRRVRAKRLIMMYAATHPGTPPEMSAVWSACLVSSCNISLQYTCHQADALMFKQGSGRSVYFPSPDTRSGPRDVSRLASPVRCSEDSMGARLPNGLKLAELPPHLNSLGGHRIMRRTADMGELLALPLEILHNIFVLCDAADLGRLCGSCSALRNHIRHNKLLHKEDPLHRDSGSPEPDWQTALHDVVALQKILETPNLMVKREDLATASRTVFKLIESANTDYAKSRNTTWLARKFGFRTKDSKNLNTLLTSSSLFRHAGYARLHFPAKTPEDRQLSAKLHVMWGIPIDFSGINEDARLRSMVEAIEPTHIYARAQVYNLSTYTEKTMWGPFKDDGTCAVDWEKVEAIFVVLGYNLNMLNTRTQGLFPPVWNKPFHGATKNSYKDPEEAPMDYMVPRKSTSVIEDDPYDITGTWMRVVCFLDYSDLYLHNFEQGGQASGFPLAVYTDEATRIIEMNLTAVKIEPPGPGDGQALPVVHFTGRSRSLHDAFDANANNNIRGTVRLTKHGDVRWTSFSVFHGEERWRSEGIQVGGPRSKRGVLGTWFDKDFSPEGPAGPTAFWKISNMLRKEGLPAH